MQAETRAEFAERSVAKLEKTIDDLEGMLFGGVCLLAFLPPNSECYYDYFSNVYCIIGSVLGKCFKKVPFSHFFLNSILFHLLFFFQTASYFYFGTSYSFTITFSWLLFSVPVRKGWF